MKRIGLQQTSAALLDYLSCSYPSISSVLIILVSDGWYMCWMQMLSKYYAKKQNCA